MGLMGLEGREIPTKEALDRRKQAEKEREEIQRRRKNKKRNYRRTFKRRLQSMSKDELIRLMMRSYENLSSSLLYEVVGHIERDWWP